MLIAIVLLSSTWMCFIYLWKFFNAGLPELEKVVVMPFVGKAEDIDLSGIPNRYFVTSFSCCRWAVSSDFLDACMAEPEQPIVTYMCFWGGGGGGGERGRKEEREVGWKMFIKYFGFLGLLISVFLQSCLTISNLLLKSLKKLLLVAKVP